MKLSKSHVLASFSWQKVILRVFAAWCLGNLGMLSANPSQSFTSLAFRQDASLLLNGGILILGFALLTVLDLLMPSWSTDAKALFVSMVGYAGTTAVSCRNYWYLFFLLAAVLPVTYYLASHGLLDLHSEKPGKELSLDGAEKRNRISAGILLSLGAAIFVFLVASIGVYRYLSYSTPNFDFGIFSNMFYRMKTSLLPDTTCERDGLLSHFAVHVSPIWYLLLPFYFLFPSPLTLQIGQAVVIAVGVIPLFLLCRHYGIRRVTTVLLCLVYFCYPALSGGTFYDIHENCFLTPLLLWLFCFFETRKRVPMYLFAVLVLTVKEDAAIYLAFFALFVIFSELGKEREQRRELHHGILLFVLAVLWFFAVTALKEKYGEPALFERSYGSYVTEGGGFIDMIKTVLLNPGYVFSQMANASLLEEKLRYLVQMFLPLVGLPFFTKKISRLSLLFPLVLMNLMPLYSYQFDIGFQYGFGSAAFLLWLTVMNLADLPPISGKSVACVCAVASLLLFSVTTLTKYTDVAARYQAGKSHYREMDAVLEQIEPEASVTCSTFLLPHLSDRDEIYELAYHEISSENPVLTDYVIIDQRYTYDEYLTAYQSLGYRISAEEAGILILTKAAR